MAKGEKSKGVSGTFEILVKNEKSSSISQTKPVRMSS